MPHNVAHGGNAAQTDSKQFRWYNVLVILAMSFGSIAMGCRQFPKVSMMETSADYLHLQIAGALSVLRWGSLPFSNTLSSRRDQMQRA